jgi:hypothetical protein
VTTAAAERYYEARHLLEMEGRKIALHNPHNLPIEDLPVIYGFNNGGPHGWMSACLIAQDGTGLGGHTCSSEAYMPHDLGILDGAREDRHETFRAHYPDGYRMEFVSGDPRQHAGLMEAYRLNQAQQRDREADNPLSPS